MPETTVTGLGGLLRVFWNHLPAGWAGEGPFRAQSIKFVSRSSGGSDTPPGVGWRRRRAEVADAHIIV